MSSIPTIYWIGLACALSICAAIFISALVKEKK